MAYLDMIDRKNIYGNGGLVNYYTGRATEEKAAAEKAKEEMLVNVAPAIYDYFDKYDEEAIAASTKPQQLFMAYDGIGLRRTETFNGNKITIITKAEKAPGLRSVPEGVKADIVNKIPMSILKELIANFKAIFDRDHTESAAQVYRKPTGEYFVYYPEQKNSAANTNYSGDQQAAVGLRTENTIVMEAHSHASMSAFFSGGDNANEKSPLSYCVIGNFSLRKPSFVGRVKLLDLSQSMEVTDLFDIPEGVDALTFDDLPEPSPQMLANAKPAIYSVYTPAVAGKQTGGSADVGAFRGSKYSKAFNDDDYWYGRMYGIDGYDNDGYDGYGGYGGYGHNYGKTKPAAEAASAKPAAVASACIDVDWVFKNLAPEDALRLHDLIAEKYADAPAEVQKAEVVEAVVVK